MIDDPFRSAADAVNQQFSTDPTPVASRVRFIAHCFEEILLVDFSNANIALMKAVAAECQRVVATRPLASVRTLVDVEGALFDKEVIQIVGELAKSNRPYVLRSAVLGVSGLRQIAFNAIASLSQRDLKVFSRKDAALAWLVE